MQRQIMQLLLLVMLLVLLLHMLLPWCYLARLLVALVLVARLKGLLFLV